MLGIISVDKYPKTSEFIAAIKDKFFDGDKVVVVVRGEEVVGLMLSPTKESVNSLDFLKD